MFFEYEGKNLFDLEQKTGLKIGLKEWSKLLLKIDSNLIKSSKEIIFCEFSSSQEINIKIKITINEPIKSLIQEFYKKIGKNFNEEEDPFIFLFNGEELDKNSDKTLEEFDIWEDFRITVLDAKDISAGYLINFMEESSGKVKCTKLNFGEKEPKGRIVKEGLNIFGICSIKSCSDSFFLI